MSFGKSVLRFALPLTALLFVWVTMRTVSAYQSESMAAFGFPLSWHAADPVSSMAFEVAILPLVVDLLVYFFVVLSIQRVVWPRVSPAAHKAPRVMTAISVVLWVAATGSALVTVAALAVDVRLETTSLGNYFGSNATRTYSAAAGLQPLTR